MAFNRIGAALLALTLVSQSAGSIIMFPLAAIFPDTEHFMFIALLSSFIGIYGIGAPVFMLILKKLPAAQGSAEKARRLSAKQLGLIFVAGMGVAYLINYAVTYYTLFVQSLLNLSEISEVMNSHINSDDPSCFH